MTRYPDPDADRYVARRMSGTRAVVALCRWSLGRYQVRDSKGGVVSIYCSIMPREGESYGAALNRFKASYGHILLSTIRVYDASGVCVWDSRDGGGP